jgi:hypothetical protein
MIAPSLAGRGRLGREMSGIVLMWIAVIALIWPGIPPGNVQIASDYQMLHQRRMSFAREALLGPNHVLPAWYPRELLGTPFWSNVQNFPFLPTRLLVLALFDPHWRYTFAVAFALAAILTALFTYLYCRRIGLGIVASAAGGWTFACCGYFVSRIAAGHLPLLEAFWGLPLLLWIIESLAQRQAKNLPITRWLCALALSCTVLSLSGHPQLPFYAMACAGVYVLWRCGIRKSILPVAAMALGVGCSGFALVPMTMLIGRSTRVLPLAAAKNDLALPYGRLLAFFLPWADGAGPPLDRRGFARFHGYDGYQYFWDTVCYIGWAPWLALPTLLILWMKFKSSAISKSVGLFLVALGVLSLALALPPVKQLMSNIPGTLMRSPVRLLYLTEFALAIALAAAIDRIIVLSPRRFAWTIVPLVLMAHLADLGWHDHYFIWSTPANPQIVNDQLAKFIQHIGDGRAAIDYNVPSSINRLVDDVGFFDSIILARPYRWLLEMSGAPADMNVELLNGGQLNETVLAAADVKVVITAVDRPDHLPLLKSWDPLKIFTVPSPAPRAEFFGGQNIIYLDHLRMHALLENSAAYSPNLLLLPPDARSAISISSFDPSQSLTVQYRRPDSDHIQCSVTTPRDGFLRLIESWDPGWSATVDGVEAPVFAAMDALQAVPVPAGKHEVALTYHTPGAIAGFGMSAVSAAMLVVLLFFFSSRSGIHDRTDR